MSIYCGKCDLYDHFFMHDYSVEDQLLKTKIYNHKGELLNIKTEADLALFFPYIIGFATGDGEGCWVCGIGSTDYIRRMELERIDIYIKDAKREKAKCKRKGMKYLPEEVFKARFSWMLNQTDKEQIMEIIERVGRSGKQKYDDIRLPSLDFYRNKWCKDLVNEYGYNEDFARKWVWHID